MTVSIHKERWNSWGPPSTTTKEEFPHFPFWERLSPSSLHRTGGLIWKFTSISALYWLLAMAAISDPFTKRPNYSRSFALFQLAAEKLFKLSKILTPYGWNVICVTSKCLNFWWKTFEQWVQVGTGGRFSEPKKGHKYPSNGPENSHRSHRDAHYSGFQKSYEKKVFKNSILQV